MLDSRTIVQLYNNVLDRDMLQYGIPNEAVRIGIESMKEVYKPNNAKQSANRSTVADYNDAAHRCAYLHKYAALHTALVRDMMLEAVRKNFGFFQHLIFSEECFKVCSLGGGPGTDVIGVLSVLYNAFTFQASISVVDYMVNWCRSFSSIISELGSGMYGSFGDISNNFLQWRYVGANLLKSFSQEVEMEISTASLVTMVKFVSAASCKDTEFMVKNIFTTMKPGAVLFFIDNDGGGFREMIIRAAHKYNFTSIFGPYCHENYTNDLVKVKRFGALSCHKTTVSIHVLQKPPEILAYGPQDSRGTQPATRAIGYGHPDYITRKVLLTSPFADGRYAGNPSPMHAVTPVPQNNGFPRHGTLNNNLCSPVQSTPLTPCVFQSYSNSHEATPRRVFMHSPLNTEIRRPVFNPSTPQPMNQSRSRLRSGCLPLPKLKHWRQHISRKFNRVKSRAYSVFQERYKRKGGRKHRDISKV